MATPTTWLFAKRYVLEKELGTGGMGAVFRAIDRLTGQTVALKRVQASTDSLLFNSISDYHDHRIALANEFKILASLRHPHIISVLDYGFDERSLPYFTMALLENPVDVLKAASDQLLPQKMALAVQMLQALTYLHRRGIVHRDLKPGNILVVNQEVRVLDFGLSIAFNQKTAVAGTLAYMAPEVLEGKPATPASDLYAVGLLLYEMLVGRHPYDTSNAATLIQELLSTAPNLIPLLQTESDLTPDMGTNAPTVIFDAPPIKPGSNQPVPAPTDNSTPTLAAIVGKLLAKHPHDRYQDAQAVIYDLTRVLHLPIALETAAIRESFLQAATFVGREGELTTLTEALTQASNGNGSGWLVGGESGVGKSRLLTELQTHAMVEGLLVLNGQAASEGTAPYSIWLDTLRRLILVSELDPVDAAIFKPLLPDIEQLLQMPIPDLPPLEPQIAQERLMDAMVSLLTRQTQPILIVLEDLHWANESLEIVRRLLPTLPTLPVLLIGTYRNEERPTLPEMLPGIRTMTLPRLNQVEIRELSEAMLGTRGQEPEVVNLLQRETEGNAFFVVEVVRALAEEAGRLDEIGRRTLPNTVFSGGVQTVIGRRLDRITPSAKPLLELAAVLGRTLDLRLLGQQAPLEGWLMECANAQILEVWENQWRFAHDKLREGLLARLLPDQRRPLHQQAAEAIETAYPDDPSFAAALTVHWGAANIPDKERVYAKIAGEQALRNSAYMDARKYLERALVLSKNVPVGEVLALHMLLGEVLLGLADYATAKTHYQTAHTHAESINDQANLIKALIGMGRAADMQGQRDESEASFQQAVLLARALNDPALTAEALVYSSAVDSLHETYDVAHTRLKEAISIFEELNNLSGLATACSAMGSLVRHMGDKAEARYYTERSLQLARELGLRARTAEVLGSLGVIECDEQHLELGLRYFFESLEILRNIGSRDGVAATLQYIAATEVLLNRPDEATAHSLEALQIFREVGHQWGIAYVLNGLGDSARAAGRHEDARAHYAEALTLRRQLGDPMSIGVVLTDSGLLRCDMGLFDEAMTHFVEAAPLLLSVGAVPFTLYCLSGVARVWASRGRRIEAIELLGLCLRHPASDSYVRFSAEPALEQLRQGLGDDEIEAALARGAGFAVEMIVAEVVREGTQDDDIHRQSVQAS